MPTYDYECPDCGNREEIFHSLTEEVKQLCSKCRKQELQRIIGKGSGIIFRGSGFYRNDARKSSASASSAKEQSADSALASKDNSVDTAKTTETTDTKKTAEKAVT